MPAPRRTPEQVSIIAEQRKKAGLWLKSKRISAGLSQRQLAEKIGFDYYTFISQIESGRGKLPTDRYEKYAQGLGVSPKEFATTMLRFNDPQLFKMIFDGQPADDQRESSNLSDLEQRLSLLEAKLMS